MYLTDSFWLQGTQGVTINNCTFIRVDGNAIFISGFNRNTTVTGEYRADAAMQSTSYGSLPHSIFSAKFASNFYSNF